MARNSVQVKAFDLPLLNRVARCAAIALCIMALTTVAIACTGCSSSKGEAKAALAQICDTLAQVDAEQDEQPAEAVAVVQDLCESVWFYPQDYAVSYDAFTACYFNGFTYSIGDAKSQKNTAGEKTVTVQLTAAVHGEEVTKSALNSAYKMARTEWGEEAFDASYAATVASGQVPDMADGALRAEYAIAPWDATQATFSVVMVQDDAGKWEPEDYAGFAAALLGGIDIRQEIS